MTTLLSALAATVVLLVPATVASLGGVQPGPSLVDCDGVVTESALHCDPRPIGWLPRAGGLAGEGAHSFIGLDSDPEGDMPRDVAITPDGTLAVVVNRDTDLMVFVDLVTVEIVASISVGDFPLDVAISGDGAYALSVNAFSNSVTVVDIATATVVAEIGVTGSQPFRIEASTDGTKAVVGVINDGFASSFSVLDLTTLTEAMSFPSTPQGVIGSFFTPAFAIFGDLVTQFALTPDGATIVLPWRGAGLVTLYDTATGTPRAEIPVAASPSAVDVSADGALAAVVHDGAASAVTVIDVERGLALATHFVPTALDPFIARLTPDAAYVMAAISNNVVFIDLASGATTATIFTGTVGDIEVSFDGQFAFVSNFNAAVIDIAAQSIVATMPFGACVDAAASTAGPVAVALNNRFREEIYVYDLAGAASSFRGYTRSGPAPEGDAPKEISISPDGTTALVSNAVSRNVSFVDLASRSVVATVDTGDVPRESAFTPDGSHALVCNGDSNTLSVIDASTFEVVATLATGQRPTRVRVSPDGEEAYVCTIAGADALFFIELDGAASAIVDSFPIGQMGAANGYTYSEVSGMELSPDGSFLALTISFDDVVRIVDTATRTIVQDVPVGDFPIRILVSPDGDAMYVANAFGDSISVLHVFEGVWIQDAVIGGIDFPLDMALDADGQFLYVGECGFQSQSIRVIDLTTFQIVATIPLSGSPREGEYVPERDQYLATTSDGFLVVVDADGADSAIVESISISGSAPDLRYSSALSLAVASAPAVPDGLDLVAFGGSTIPGDLDGDGDVDGADLGLMLAAWGGRGSADLDGSGSVDGADLGLLLANWS